MVNTNLFRAKYVEKGLTQEQLAEKIGMSTRTLSNKLKKGAFGTDEVEKICKALDINRIAQRDAIFFAK